MKNSLLKLMWIYVLMCTAATFADKGYFKYPTYLYNHNCRAAQPPTISSFSPSNAKPGDVITIWGTNFNTTAASNIVFFGATQATVTAASTTTITAIVPVGATYAPITVLNAATVLSTSSGSNFTPISFAHAKLFIFLTKKLSLQTQQFNYNDEFNRTRN